VFKEKVRRLIERAGYRIYAPRQLPIGLNWLLDVERLIGSPDKVQTIFDVGANVGQTALLLNRRFPHSTIYTFEPLAATFAQLCENTRTLQTVVCEHCALGSETKSVELYPKAASTQNSLVPEFNIASGRGAETIEVRRVDDILQQRSILHLNLLKTDTEGFDLEVMKGAGDALKRGTIDTIISEVGFHPYRRHHTYLYDLQEFLSEHGYELYGMYDQNHYDGRIDYADALFVSPRIRQSCNRIYAETFNKNAE
jgi:FkbM family methyltransferase